MNHPKSAAQSRRVYSIGAMADASLTRGGDPQTRHAERLPRQRRRVGGTPLTVLRGFAGLDRATAPYRLSGVLYPSVLNVGGTCLACFLPALDGILRRGARVGFTWDGGSKPHIELEALVGFVARWFARVMSAAPAGLCLLSAICLTARFPR